MLNLCVCMETVFPNLKFTDRLKKIAKLGFDSAEFWFWDYEFDGTKLNSKKKNIREIAALSTELKISINDIVVNSPDGSIGGFLTKPEDKNKYLDRLSETIEIARQLKCKKMITCTGNEIPGIPRIKQTDSIIKTLSAAVQIAEKSNVTLLLEPLNSYVDHPGYFLTSSSLGLEIVKKINHPHLRLLYDVYHMQIMEGNILANIEKNITCIGHFHLAGVPGRHELYLGELNYKHIFDTINRLGYKGKLGLEYFPTVESAKSLTRIKETLS